LRLSSSALSAVILFLRTPRPPLSTPFPYTTLFRSRGCQAAPTAPVSAVYDRVCAATSRSSFASTSSVRASRRRPASRVSVGRTRSEEHTSELQSRENLVCRLLLEKKKEAQSDSCHS